MERTDFVHVFVALLTIGIISGEFKDHEIDHDYAADYEFMDMENITEEHILGSFPNSSYMAELEEFLFEGGHSEHFYYDTSVRPRIFSQLDVAADFYLIGIGEVNEKKGLIVPSGILVMYWRDPRLTWEPEHFGNITTASFDGYKIWTPTFIHNGGHSLSVAESVITTDVSHKGQVVLVLAIHEEIPCRFDMTNFPRDEQTCSMYLFHADPLVRLHAGHGDVMQPGNNIEGSLKHHAAWDVRNVSIRTLMEKGGSHQYDVYVISMKMKRNASFFLRIYVTPVCFLLLLIPVIFLLPPASSEKLTYGAVLLFCMIYVGQTVEAIYPPYTDATPYLIQLTTASGALLFLCILLTSIISSIEANGRKRALPLWMKKYIVTFLGPYLLVKENEDSLSHGTVHIKPIGDSDKDYIVQSEQTMEYSEEYNGGISSAEGGTDTNRTLQALVSELKQSRLQSRAHDDWTNLFTVINRLLFILSFLVGVIIILCFA